MGVGSRFVEFAADGERRIEPRVLQRDDGHRGRRGLPVCSGDEQCSVAGHQSRENMRPQQDRDTALTRRDEFWIRLGYGGMRRDHDGRTAGQQVECCGVVSDRDLGPPRAQSDDAAAGLGIRPGHLAATRQQDARETRHSGAADTDHVDSLELFWQRCGSRLTVC